MKNSIRDLSPVLCGKCGGIRAARPHREEGRCPGRGPPSPYGPLNPSASAGSTPRARCRRQHHAAPGRTARRTAPLAPRGHGADPGRAPRATGRTPSGPRPRPARAEAKRPRPRPACRSARPRPAPAGRSARAGAAAAAAVTLPRLAPPPAAAGERERASAVSGSAERRAGAVARPSSPRGSGPLS